MMANGDPLDRYFYPTLTLILGQVAQSVRCLATVAHVTADPGIVSLIPAGSHTFVEIDREIISMAILLPSADKFKKGCCQLQAKICAQSTRYMTIAVDWDVKATKQTNITLTLRVLMFYRGSYMSADVLLNLFNWLGKRDKM